MMDRRAFFSGITAGLLAAPLVIEAQQAGKVPQVGILAMGPPASFSTISSIFAGSLRELGYVEGSQVVLEPRFADIGKPEQFDQLAVDLVRSHVDVIVAVLNSAIAAVKRATSTIPIVMVNSFDPVGQGLVRSLARPEANVTGLAWDANTMVLGKILALASEALPGLRVSGCWWTQRLPRHTSPRSTRPASSGISGSCASRFESRMTSTRHSPP